MFKKLWYVSSFLFLCLCSNHVMAGEIHEAAKKGDLKTVKKILAKDITRIHAQDEVGYTPLSWAAVRGKWDVLKFLLEAGADVNYQGIDRCAALFSACNHDRPEIILLLLARGADMEHKNAWGNTALSLAAQKGNARVVALLISKGADINTASHEGWTPLHYARKADHQEVVDILLDAGADATIKDSYGKAALDYTFKRPPPVSLEKNKLHEYAGEYTMPDGFYFIVWVENDRLWFQDYAHERLYPIGVDSFYSEKEPWLISFSRNDKGEVDSLYAGFLRQTLAAARDREIKVRNVKKYRVGLLCEDVARETIPDRYRQLISPLSGFDSTVTSVIVVIENSPVDKAGIRCGDIILKFKDVPISTYLQLKNLLIKEPSGARIPLEILRGGEVLKTSVILN
ncbi:MAG: ankyrin repeat domain-containing protein [candidate division Zixibacteria bacterium]|nr:ankyrin repeat domain-containing protein [candidate division Zixibacteria bacterium]MDD5425195.1 ankyrin repeat domain-containing protein [candidate division Zixibacteria bacterium]